MKEKNYCKNKSDDNLTLSLNFSGVFSLCILGAGLKGFKSIEIDLYQIANMRIGEIASSAVYQMDEQF